MVSGFLGTLTTEERTLLHLMFHHLPEGVWEAPVEKPADKDNWNEDTQNWE